jgi:hypothetical protein
MRLLGHGNMVKLLDGAYSWCEGGFNPTLLPLDMHSAAVGSD